jgi:ABC-type multidrug transport system ATPase subunit
MPNLHDSRSSSGAEGWALRWPASRKKAHDHPQFGRRWKQRLAWGCTILHEPSILFLDEPTSAWILRRQFWDLIYEMAGKVTVFVTTHYMDEASTATAWP